MTVEVGKSGALREEFKRGRFSFNGSACGAGAETVLALPAAYSTAAAPKMNELAGRDPRCDHPSRHRHADLQRFTGQRTSWPWRTTRQIMKASRSNHEIQSELFENTFRQQAAKIRRPRAAECVERTQATGSVPAVHTATRAPWIHRSHQRQPKT